MARCSGPSFHGSVILGLFVICNDCWVIRSIASLVYRLNCKYKMSDCQSLRTGILKTTSLDMGKLTPSIVTQSFNLNQQTSPRSKLFVSLMRRMFKLTVIGKPWTWIALLQAIVKVGVLEGIVKLCYVGGTWELMRHTDVMYMLRTVVSTKVLPIPVNYPCRRNYVCE